MKNKTIFLIVGLMLCFLSTYAQTPQNAHPSAALELSSTTKGFLPPRMSTAQRNAITNPAKGLTIFNLNTDKINLYDGTRWLALVDDTQASISIVSQTDFDAIDTNTLLMGSAYLNTGDYKLYIWNGNFFNIYRDNEVSTSANTKIRNTTNFGTTSSLGSVFNTEVSQPFLNVVNEYLTTNLSQSELDHILNNRSQYQIEVAVGDRRGSNTDRIGWVTLGNQESSQTFPVPLGSTAEYTFVITLTNSGNFTVTSQHAGFENDYGAVRGVRITNL